MDAIEVYVKRMDDGLTMTFCIKNIKRTKKNSVKMNKGKKSRDCN